jgi:hypothetical protein
LPIRKILEIKVFIYKKNPLVKIIFFRSKFNQKNQQKNILRSLSSWRQQINEAVKNKEQLGTWKFECVLWWTNLHGHGLIKNSSKLSCWKGSSNLSLLLVILWFPFGSDSPQHQESFQFGNPSWNPWNKQKKSLSGYIEFNTKLG